MGVVVGSWHLHTVLKYPLCWTQFDKILLTVQNISPILIIEHKFGIVIMKGDYEMLRQNEEELLRIIRENDEPEQAALTAIDVILAYLMQPESFEAQAAVCLQVSV